MKVIKENVGNTTIAIQATDEALEILGEETGRATQLTGVGDKVENAYAKVKSLIKTLATDIGTELKTIETTSRPEVVEMEFQIGLSAQIGPVLLLCGKGDYAMKVKMTWNLGRDGKKPD